MRRSPSVLARATRSWSVNAFKPGLSVHAAKRAGQTTQEHIDVLMDRAQVEEALCMIASGGATEKAEDNKREAELLLGLLKDLDSSSVEGMRRLAVKLSIYSSAVRRQARRSGLKKESDSEERERTPVPGLASENSEFCHDVFDKALALIYAKSAAANLELLFNLCLGIASTLSSADYYWSSLETTPFRRAAVMIPQRASFGLLEERLSHVWFFPFISLPFSSPCLLSLHSRLCRVDRGAA